MQSTSLTCIFVWILSILLECVFSGYEDNIYGGGWQLVRRVKSGTTWHPATDNLLGTDTYGARGTSQGLYSNADREIDDTFSIKYDNIDFDEIMFSAGDGLYWLIVKKEDLNIITASTGGWLKVLASSDYSYFHKNLFFNRNNYAYDPHISLFDWHYNGLVKYTALYIEASRSDGITDTILQNHNGCNVWIRKTPLAAVSQYPCLDKTYAYEDKIDGGGWKLVRRVKAGDIWHPANDDLAGTESYGYRGQSTIITNNLYNNNDRLIDDTFSIKWDNYDFDEFLFSTGDGKYWTIIQKNKLIGQYGNPLQLERVKSSDLDNIHTLQAWKRTTNPADPAIGLFDFWNIPTWTILEENTMLYLENSHFGLTNGLEEHFGANVWIRKNIEICKLIGYNRNIIFILDNSGSIGSDINYNKMKTFMKDIIINDIDSSNNSKDFISNIGIISFHTQTTVDYSLQNIQSLDRTLLFNTIDNNMVWNGINGNTRTKDAILIALDEIININNNSNENLIILLTDGLPTNDETGNYNACKELTYIDKIDSIENKLNDLNNNVKFVIIGINTNNDLLKLQCLVNNQNDLVYIDTFDQLSQINSISDICENQNQVQRRLLIDRLNIN